MTARVGRDDRVFAREFVAAGILPVVVTACSTVKEQQRLAVTLPLVIQVDAVHR